MVPPSALCPLPSHLVKLNCYREPHSSMAHPHLCSFAFQQIIIYWAFRDLLSYFQGNLTTYTIPPVFFLVKSKLHCMWQMWVLARVTLASVTNNPTPNCQWCNAIEVNFSLA